MSEVFCYVKIACNDHEMPSELKVVEVVISFTEVEDSFVIGFCKLITDSIHQKEFNIKNCHGQGCDDFEVKSGKFSCLQKKSKMWLHMLTTCVVLRVI